MIRIENKEVITTHTMTSIEILDGEISMKDRYASFPVRIYDENNNLLFVNRVDIKDEEYDAWNSDDYIEDLILSRLDMKKYVDPTLEPAVEPVVEVISEPVVEPIIDDTSESNPTPGPADSPEVI
jgi:hypothetical protein